MSKSLVSNRLFLILLPLILTACKSLGSDDENIKTYWVNSARVPCVGVAPMDCLQIRRAGDPNWQLFYSQIEGFDYRPGYLYKIQVLEEKLAPQKIPADGNSIKYTLVSVIEKKSDVRLRLNDIWVLEKIEGRRISKEELTPPMQRPYVEFHIRDNRYLGNDGCNNFRGQIEAVGEKALHLSPAAGTKMSCGNLTLPTTFLQLLSRVDQYQAAGGFLVLLEGEAELMKFRKTD
jgi:heat shock protein HslJ